MFSLRRFLAGLGSRAVGTDRFGNAYFESRAVTPVYNRTRRRVVYAGPPDPTMVPPEWHAWLHHTVAAPLDEARRYDWQKEHQPNRTGTRLAYRPPGHPYAAGRPGSAAGDYDAWTPDPPAGG